MSKRMDRRRFLIGKGQYEFAVMGTVGASNDPDSISAFVGTATPAYPRSFGFSSARIDRLLAAGRVELEVEKRKRIYDEVQRAAAEEVPNVGLTWRAQAYGMQRSVAGFRNFPGFLTFYAPISLEDAVKT